MKQSQLSKLFNFKFWITFSRSRPPRARVHVGATQLRLFVARTTRPRPGLPPNLGPVHSLRRQGEELRRSPSSHLNLDSPDFRRRRNQRFGPRSRPEDDSSEFDEIGQKCRVRGSRVYQFAQLRIFCQTNCLASSLLN